MLTPYAQYFSLVIVLFIFGCEFYLACFPFGEKGSAKSFFSTYLAAPLFVFDYLVYKVCRPSNLFLRRRRGC
jgi:amino acid transporter